MKNRKLIKYEEVSEMFEYSEASPSGLVWKVKPKFSTLNIGDNAGCLASNKKWVVSYNKSVKQCHRVVWSLLNKVDVLEQTILAVDNDYSRVRIDNLWDVSDFKIPLKNISEVLKYDESSPTCIVWATDILSSQGKVYKKSGTAAGCVTSGNIIIDGVSFFIEDVVLELNGLKKPEDFVVVFKDGNNRNYRISNLCVRKRLKNVKKLRPRESLEEFIVREKLELAKEDRKILNLKNRTNTIERKLVTSAKERSKKFNLEFDITADDILIPDFCPILEIPLFRGNGAACANSPSLDRKDPKKGYTKENIWVISHKANTMKSDADSELLIKFAKWAIDEYN